ncbi:alpha/beta hydrolase [Sphaerisporangium sp. TRM90804]|uniref:alpha/beta hydrolase n=1 Tax=Sphaerisporangium sp. TRM90804 TaxID=3031113 RepID=UPI00244A2011|nr:alpha/beta hydrolase [Sphaerisporangium sp. TRM90804]MDH2426288.1 alpha/beta hydrolase [Sphaerisporangium sp. TRM90804]
MEVLVVAGPGVVADAGLLEETAAAEWAALGVQGRFAAVADVAALAAELERAGEGCALVALPGPDPEARRLMDVASGHAPRTVWLDLDRTGPRTVAGGAAHVRGRGVAGLGWAVRHAVHRLRRPARRIPYGPHPDQWADLRLPAAGARLPAPAPKTPASDPSPTTPDPRPGPVEPRTPAVGSVAPPVVVLVHGGYWRSVWAADLMDALAIDLADRGFASWNLEYRRPDLHGWAATTADVAAGVEALASAGTPLDLARVAVAGHSAGGQLALRAAADRARGGGDRPGAAADARRAAPSPAAPSAGSGEGSPVVTLAVSLAGVLDLVAADRRHVSAGAVAGALGGGADEIPEVYAASSPLERLPLGVPQLVVQGASDDPDLVDVNRRYARAAGEEAVYLELPGDHFAVVDPASAIWHATAAELAARLTR